MAITITVNGQAHSLDVEPDTPLLWAIRDTLGLTGTKFGCGISACGACTVHLDGRAIRSCTFPISAAEGAAITTIEGLAKDGTLHKVQQAWVAHQVPQCGYCQSGMIMAVSALLEQRPKPSDDQIDATITNICRCGTFARVRRAIHAIAEGLDRYGHMDTTRFYRHRDSRWRRFRLGGCGCHLCTEPARRRGR